LNHAGRSLAVCEKTLEGVSVGSIACLNRPLDIPFHIVVSSSPMRAEVTASSR
jgi:hypothetical protein